MTGTDWPWRRVTGALGIAFFVGFAIALLGLILPTEPATDAPIEEIRDFFDDDAALLHSANWLIALSFVFFFLPFASGLRAVLSERDVDGGMWTRAAYGAAVAIVALGGASSAFMSSAALAFDSGDLGDDVLRLVIWADDFMVASALPFGIALFLAANSITVLRTGVFPSWVGWSGLASAAIGLIGAWWPLDGDPEGFLATLGFLTAPLLAIWVLTVGIILVRSEPSSA